MKNNLKIATLVIYLIAMSVSLTSGFGLAQAQTEEPPIAAQSEPIQPVVNAAEEILAVSNTNTLLIIAMVLVAVVVLGNQFINAQSLAKMTDAVKTLTDNAVGRSLAVPAAATLDSLGDSIEQKFLSDDQEWNDKFGAMIDDWLDRNADKLRAYATASEAGDIVGDMEQAVFKAGAGNAPE